MRTELAISLSVHKTFARCFSDRYINSGNIAAQGTVLAIWTAHHTSRNHHADFQAEIPSALSERDQCIVRALNFVDYTSPSDCVTVQIPEISVPQDAVDLTHIGDEDSHAYRSKDPEIMEVMNQRRAGLRERRKQLQVAWRGWVKPVV